MSFFTLGDGVGVVVLAIGLAVVYLLLLRLVDLNEKEPLWALSLLFGCGALAGLTLYVLLPSTLLQLSYVIGPIAEVAAIVVAIIAGLAALEAIGRGRGGSEVGGTLDGMLYGAAAGLGFSTGAAFVRHLVLLVRSDGMDGLVRASGAGVLWTLAVSGLIYGVLGAIVGAGLATALGAAGRRRLTGLLGILVAGTVAVLYTLLAYGGTLTPTAQLRANLALILPLALLAGVAVTSLRRERRVIESQVDEEMVLGSITEEEARLLRNLPARRIASLQRLQRLDFDGWGDLRALHNHQVRLLLAKDRAQRGTDPDLARRSMADVVALRSAIAAIRAENPSLSSTRATRVGA